MTMQITAAPRMRPIAIALSINIVTVQLMGVSARDSLFNGESLARVSARREEMESGGGSFSSHSRLTASHHTLRPDVPVC